MNTSDGRNPPTTADDLAAEGDQVTHVYNTPTSGPITVDLTVDSSTYSAVGSLPVTVDVNAGTTTNLWPDNPSPNFGDKVTLTAQVTGNLTGIGMPTGTVDFYDGTMYLGSETLDSSGMASFTTPPLDLGSLGTGEHDFTAVYNGDDAFLASTSSDAGVWIESNTAGSVDLSGNPTTVNEGDTYSLGLPASGPGDATFSEWGINWGDGTPVEDVTDLSSLSASHTYGAAGGFTITAVAVDSYGAYGASLGVTVTHVGPSSLALSVDNAYYSGADTEDGGSLAPDQLHVSFTGPASQESYNVSINFGDGSASTTFALGPGQTTFDYPLPQYANPGSYGIIVTVTDAEGNSANNAAEPLQVTYSNSAPSSLALSLDNSTVYAGDAGPTLSGSFTDPQSDFAHVVTIDWGDGGGTPDLTTINLGAGETTFQADPHSYANASTDPYTISVTVTGMDGTATANTSVTVTRAPSEVMIGATTPEASEYIGSASSGEPTSPYFGAFSVTCGGGSAGNIAVSFSLGGGAVCGTDYTLSSSADLTVSGQSGTITMAGDGPGTATIYVVPIDVSVVGGSKTVTLTLTSGTGYNIVSGWSAANVTINDDDLPPTPWSGDATPQITAFSHGGAAVSSASAPLGDFIPIEIWIPSGVQSSALFALDCPSGISIAYTPNGPNVGGTGIPGGPPFGRLGPGYGYYLMLYASAADPSDDQANDEGVSGDIKLEWASGGAYFQPCSTNVEFDPLELDRNFVDINGGSAASPGPVGVECTAPVGQMVNLNVYDPSGRVGLVDWASPPGHVIKDYRPQIDDDTPAPSCKPIYLGNSDLHTVMIVDGAQSYSPPLSFTWVDGGSGLNESADVYDPFGGEEVEATFDAPKPTVDLTATPENVANTLKGTGYVTLATGNNGVNMFACSFTNPKTNALEHSGVVGYMCVPTNARSDLRKQAGITFNAYPPDVHAAASSFEFAWVQVVDKYSTKETLFRNNSVPIGAPVVDGIPSQQRALDNSFPYTVVGGIEPSNYLSTWDNPRYIVTPTTRDGTLNILSLPSTYTYRLSYNFAATMWYMCRPLSGGKWIPIADFSWGVNFSATGTGTKNSVTRWKISGSGPKPAGNKPIDFTETTDFPQWDAVKKNSAAANNFNWIKRSP